MRISEALKIKQIPLTLVIVGMWVVFFHEVLKSFGIMIMYVAYGGFFILFAALLIELKKGYLSLLTNTYRFWILGIWGFSFFALLYGILKEHSLQFLSRDVFPYSYFACLLMAARSNAWRAIDRMIFQQFCVGLAVFLYILVTIDLPEFTRDAISLNTESWSGPRVYWAWGLLFGWQYLLLKFNRNLPIVQKIVTLVGITCFIVFGVFMLKRQVILEVGMILVCKAIYSAVVEKVSVFKLAGVFVVIAAVSFSFIRLYESRVNVEYFQEIISRMTEEGTVLKTVLQNTRLLETPQNIYQQANEYEILYGQGLGSGVEKDGVVDTVVESGFFTLFLKGGIMYLIVWYLGFIYILKDTVFGRNRDKLLFRLLSALFIIVSPIGPFFIDYFSTGYKMLWLGACTSRARDFNT